MESFQIQMDAMFERISSAIRTSLRAEFEQLLQNQAQQTIDHVASQLSSFKTNLEESFNSKLDAVTAELDAAVITIDSQNETLQLIQSDLVEMKLTGKQVDIRADAELLDRMFDRTQAQLEGIAKHQLSPIVTGLVDKRLDELLPQLDAQKPGYTVSTSKQDSLQDLFSKFLVTGTQSLKKFAVLLILSTLAYALPKKRVPPDKIFLFCCDFMFVICICILFVFYSVS